MNNTYNGLDLTVAVSNQIIKSGDHVTYDPIKFHDNGPFNTLTQFKSFLSRHFVYKHLIGEEYHKGLCFYEIVELL